MSVQETVQREITFYEDKIRLCELRLRAAEDVAKEPFADFGSEMLQDQVDEAERDYERFSAKLAIARAMLERTMPQINENGEVDISKYLEEVA